MVVRSHGDLSQTSCLRLFLASLAPKLTLHCGLLLQWKLGLIKWLWNGIVSWIMDSAMTTAAELASKKMPRKKEKGAKSLLQHLSFDAICPSQACLGKWGELIVSKWGRRGRWSCLVSKYGGTFHSQTLKTSQPASQKAAYLETITLPALVVKRTKAMFTYKVKMGWAQLGKVRHVEAWGSKYRSPEPI